VIAFKRLTCDAAELRALLPAELADGPRWVAWRELVRDGKVTKVPTDPRTGQNASTTDPTTWGTLEQAAAYHLRTHNSSGVGRVFSAEDGLAGIDLDGCADEHGVLEPWARAILDLFPDAYAERSPSGRGLKLWVRGRISDARKIDEYAGAGTAVELYGIKRYFTVTGDVLGTAPRRLPDHQATLDGLLADLAIVARTKRGTAAEKFARLWIGDASDYDGDESKADLALCSLLARRTTDRLQLDRLFRLSGLMREKWSRDDYRDRTIAKALEQDTEHHAPGDEQTGPDPGAEPASEVPPIAFLDLVAIRERGIPPVPWIVDGWLAEQDIAQVSGDGGIGKSTTVAALAAGVATGGTWCGLPVLRTGKVLVIDEEQSEREVSRLYLRLGAPHHNLLVASQQGVNLTSKEGLDRLEHALAEHRPLLVVFDSVQQVFTNVDANNAGEVARVYRELFRLRRLYGTTFVLIGHLRKPPTQGQVSKLHLVHGSVAFSTQPSTVWVATQPAAGLLDLTQEKRRDSEKTSLRVRYQTEGPDAPIVLTGEGQVEEQETAVERAQDFVVGYLLQHGTSPTGWILKAAAEQTPPIAKRMVERALRNLRRIGRVYQPQHGYNELVKPAETP
jgi:hypothetical protein